MWCAAAGLTVATRQDHAAYLSHWLRILKADPRSLVTVAGKAQHAVDHLDRCAGEMSTVVDRGAA